MVIFGASAGLFPHRLSDDVEGERRVFHVALTRAGTQAVLLADRDAPSTFLAELDGTAPHAPSHRYRGPPDGLRRAAPSDAADRRPSSASAPGSGGPGEAALRAWRSSVARKDGVPAYVVLNDKELVGIAERRPVDLAASSDSAAGWARSAWSDGATRSSAVLEGAVEATRPQPEPSGIRQPPPTLWP